MFLLACDSILFIYFIYLIKQHPMIGSLSRSMSQKMCQILSTYIYIVELIEISCRDESREYIETNENEVL
jgi:hypothetical protein